MKTTPVTANAFQLTRLGLVNCYLVREDDGLTLIDTGLPGSANDILEAARIVGPIRRILLTHAHMDHVGSVDAIVARLRSTEQPVEIAGSSRSVPLLLQPPDKTLAPGEPAGEIKGGLPGIKTRLTRHVEDGDVYGSFRVIATPGHIPGHLAFLDERDGTLYAGDALVGVRVISVSGFSPWYFPLANPATWNKDVALASAKRLLDYPIERFACGHGRVQTGGTAALRAAIAKL